VPRGVAFLEDSVTAPTYRGRGIASAAWQQIAGVLPTEGLCELVTIVDVTNVASRRAVTKAGFQEVAVSRPRIVLGAQRAERRPHPAEARSVRGLSGRLSTPLSPRERAK